MSRRASPDRTLRAILDSKDRAQALERLTVALRHTWGSGYRVGFADGVSDATDDEPTVTANPYV